MLDRDQEYLSAAQIARRYEVDSTTVLGWSRRGLRGPGGKRIYLRGTRIGGKVRFTPDAVADFLAELNGVERVREDSSESIRKRVEAAKERMKRRRS